jgi:hypothetical protein
MSEVARMKVLEDVLEEREKQEVSWERYGQDVEALLPLLEVLKPLQNDRYFEVIRLAAVCFAWAEAYLKGDKINERYG